MLSRMKDVCVSGVCRAGRAVNRHGKALGVLCAMGLLTVGQVASAEQFDGFVSADDTSGDVSLDPTVFSDWLVDNMTSAIAAILAIFAVMLGVKLVFTIFRRYAK